YQIVLNLGLLFALNAPFTALAPPLLILALALVYRFDRRG
ncbi:TPA: LPS export ABC transporter permease LptG, partial [Serratia marcescens]